MHVKYNWKIRLTCYEQTLETILVPSSYPQPQHK